MNSRKGYHLRVEVIAILTLFYFMLQACSPGDTYSVSKASLNLSANSGGVTATPVPIPNSSNPANGPLCSWQWADDFAPPTPLSLRPPIRAINCTQANIGQKQNVIDSSADWTCLCQTPPAASPTPTPTPPPATSPTPTPTPPVTTDGCPSVTPIQYELDAASPYVKFKTGHYASQSFNVSSSGMTALSYVKLEDQTNVVIRLNVRATDTTLGKQWPASTAYAEVSANIGSQYITISKSKCDFSASAFWLTVPAPAPPEFRGGSYFSINEPNRLATSGATFNNLTTGTWYINIKNFGTKCNVPYDGNWCDILFEWAN